MLFNCLWFVLVVVAGSIGTKVNFSVLMMFSGLPICLLIYFTQTNCFTTINMLYEVCYSSETSWALSKKKKKTSAVL